MRHYWYDNIPWRKPSMSQITLHASVVFFSLFFWSICVIVLGIHLIHIENLEQKCTNESDFIHSCPHMIDLDIRDVNFTIRLSWLPGQVGTLAWYSGSFWRQFYFTHWLLSDPIRPLSSTVTHNQIMHTCIVLPCPNWWLTYSFDNGFASPLDINSSVKFPIIQAIDLHVPAAWAFCTHCFFVAGVQVDSRWWTHSTVPLPATLFCAHSHPHTVEVPTENTQRYLSSTPCAHSAYLPLSNCSYSTEMSIDVFN